MFHHINVASKNIHQVYDDTALLEKPYFWWKIEKYVEVGIYRVLATAELSRRSLDHNDRKQKAMTLY